jgi:hypothetical protein
VHSAFDSVLPEKTRMPPQTCAAGPQSGARRVTRMNPSFTTRMSICPRAVAWKILFLLSSLVACHSTQQGTSSARVTSTFSGTARPSEGDDALDRAYPKAHWRVASPLTLSRVVLWTSVILVRHRGSDQQAPFCPMWNVEPPPPDRSRDEALTIARSLAEQASADPERFSRLAQESSEDVVTSIQGGALGPMSEGQLSTEGGEVLDALAATPQGGVTRVIETRHGFEILFRRRPPALESVAGRVGVIPYDGAGTTFEAPAHPGRTHAEARTLARKVIEEGRTDPAAFDRFVATFPAPRDVTADGNIGQWTTQETGSWGREREQLAMIPIGALTEPLEMPSGVAVFERTPADMPVYAMRAIELSFADAAAPSDPNSRDSRLQLARSIARALARDPSQLDAFQKQYCCQTVEQWSEGRRPHEFIVAAAGLRAGALYGEPLAYGNSFVVAQRVDPATAPAPLFDLPAPEVADAAEFGAVGFTGSGVQAAIRGLGDEAARKLDLGPTEARRLTDLHEQFATAFDAGESRLTREHALILFDQELRSILSDGQYRTYRVLADATVTANLMKSR